MTDTDTAIVEIITFNNEIFVDFNSFTKQVQTTLKAENSNYEDNYKEHNNRYKKCPHCGTIWFKVKGCNGMQCGRRTRLKDIFSGRFKNYLVKFCKGVFNIITLDDKKVDDMGQDTEHYGLFPDEIEKNKNRSGKFTTISGDQRDGALTKHVQYLQDAEYTVYVGNESEDLLLTIYQAIQNPVYSLFIGKRSCVPNKPIVTKFELFNEEDLVNVYNCS